MFLEASKPREDHKIHVQNVRSSEFETVAVLVCCALEVELMDAVGRGRVREQLDYVQGAAVLRYQHQSSRQTS